MALAIILSSLLFSFLSVSFANIVSSDLTALGYGSEAAYAHARRIVADHGIDYSSSSLPVSSDPLDDSDLVDIVLVASVDGKFHALNRTTGHILWSMASDDGFSTATTHSNFSALAPLVRTKHPFASNPQHEKIPDPYASPSEFYIVEPQSGDIYVTSPLGPLQRFRYSMPQLVDMAPFAFSDDDFQRIFTGRKESRLVSVELETGRIREVIGSEECAWDPLSELNSDKNEEKVVDLDELEEGAELYEDESHDEFGPKHEEKKSSAQVYIGRTDYHISITTKPKPSSTYSDKRPPPVQNLIFSVYGPNNQDSNLQTRYTRTKDDKYVASLPTGEVFAFKAIGKSAEELKPDTNMPFWSQKFRNPIVATFDVLRRHDPKPNTSNINEEHNEHFVLLQPPPALKDFHPSLDPSLYQSQQAYTATPSSDPQATIDEEYQEQFRRLLPNADSAYVGMIEETGSLFAMSPDKYPFVAFGGQWEGPNVKEKLLDAAPEHDGHEDEDEDEDFVSLDELTRRRKEKEAMQETQSTRESSTSSTSTTSTKTRSTSRVDSCSLGEGGVFAARCLVGVRKVDGATASGSAAINPPMDRPSGRHIGSRERSGLNDPDTDGRSGRLLDAPKRDEYGVPLEDNSSNVGAVSVPSSNPPPQTQEPGEGPGVFSKVSAFLSILALGSTSAATIAFTLLLGLVVSGIFGLRYRTGLFKTEIARHVQLNTTSQSAVGGVIDPNVLANGITNADADMSVETIQKELSQLASEATPAYEPSLDSETVEQVTTERPRADSAASSSAKDATLSKSVSKSPVVKPSKLPPPSTPKSSNVKLPPTPGTPTPSTPKAATQQRTRKQSTTAHSRSATDSVSVEESDIDFEMIEPDVEDGEGDEEGEGENEEGNGEVEAPRKTKATRRGKRGKKKRKGAAGTEANGVAAPAVVVTTPRAVVPPPAVSPSLLVVPTAPAVTQPSLIVSDIILGFGSHGTVVFRGDLQGRQVAVKRLLRSFVTLASREVSILQESDDHPNVIRYYYQEAHADFLYIALELCPATLADIIEYASNGGLESGGAGKEGMKADDWEDMIRCFEPKKALKQITSGLRHLHALKLVHRDIKPQNILVSARPSRGGRGVARGSMGGYRMLISDFGLCKKLDMDQTSFLPTAQGAMGAGTVGWRAPEILRGEVKMDEFNADDNSSRGSSTGTVTGASIGSNTTSGSSGSTPANGAKPTRLTKSVDIFALGCLFYYTLTNGLHPFGDRFEREVNIMKGAKNLDGLYRVDAGGGGSGAWSEEGAEARDLIERMLSDTAQDRPDTTTCLLHPYFWDSGRRLNFLQDASDRFEIMCRDPKDDHLLTLEHVATDVVGNDWYSKMDKVFIENLGKFRKYDGKSVQDLLRALRNKKHHYQDLPDNVKRHLGPMPEGYLAYFTKRYPKLFMHVHHVIDDCELKDEPMFRTYFELAEH